MSFSSHPRTRQFDLLHKVAVVTGASRGIGRAIALNLASRGCSILGTCISERGRDGITATLNSEVTIGFETTGGQRHASIHIKGLIADIFSPTCAQDIADELEKSFESHVDIFVNSACDPMPGIIGQMGVEEIQRSMVGNIQTPVLIVEELVKRRLFQPESRIIYLSSIRTRQPWSMQLMYSAGKSAGESLCRTWAQAFGGKEEKYSFMAGTTANAVTVGLTATEAVTDCGPEAVERFKAEFLPLQSIPRLGQAKDVADVVGLLCSSDARWVTGCVVSASGGGIKIG